MKFVFLILGIVPGMGQAHAGAPLKGALQFVLFVLFINGFFMVPYWFPEYRHRGILRSGALILAAVVWGYSFLSHVRATLGKSTGSGSSKASGTEHGDSSGGEMT